MNIKNKSIKYLFGSSLTSVLFIVSTLGIILFAIYGKWLVFAFSIAGAVVGCYLSPLLWVYFAETIKLNKIAKFILKTKEIELSTLAKRYHKTNSKMRYYIQMIIMYNIIPAMQFEDDIIKI